MIYAFLDGVPTGIAQVATKTPAKLKWLRTFEIPSKSIQNNVACHDMIMVFCLSSTDYVRLEISVATNQFPKTAKQTCKTCKGMGNP